MNIDQFLKSFPEFADTDLQLLTTKLAEASLELDLTSTGWGPLSVKGSDPTTLADTAHGYLTAHKLALSPFGQNARMIANNGETTYMAHFRELVRKTIPGVWVAGADQVYCW